MKNKKKFITLSSCSIVIFAASFFLLNSAYAGKNCGVSHTSKAPTVVAPAQKQAQHVDEHAGHGHAPVKVQKQPVDEHAGHNHAPKETHTNNH